MQQYTQRHIPATDPFERDTSIGIIVGVIVVILLALLLLVGLPYLRGTTPYQTGTDTIDQTTPTTESSLNAGVNVSGQAGY
jgi:mannose/fructose/N-acetylgalactosamine-specific phosphotransferase system component IID